MNAKKKAKKLMVCEEGKRKKKLPGVFS